MTRPLLRLLALAAALPALSSCAVLGKTEEPPPCPPIFILGDAAQITKFRPGQGRDLTDVEAEGEVLGFSGGCTYDEKGALIDLQVTLGVNRGPADTDRKVDLTYFVAIPKFYPAPEAKAVFPVTITFPEGANFARHVDEEVVMRLPVKDKELIDSYEIYIGFQTSAEELEMNRKLRK